MSFTVKIAILVAVALGELVTVGLVGSKMESPNRFPITIALAVSSIATLAVVGYVLFVVVE